MNCQSVRFRNLFIKLLLKCGTFNQTAWAVYFSFFWKLTRTSLWNVFKKASKRLTILVLNHDNMGFDYLLRNLRISQFLNISTLVVFGTITKIDYRNYQESYRAFIIDQGILYSQRYFYILVISKKVKLTKTH